MCYGKKLHFNDCEIPVEAVIGGEPMIGQGFTTSMKVLDRGRLMLAARAVGSAQKASNLSVKYAKDEGAVWKTNRALPVDH